MACGSSISDSDPSPTTMATFCDLPAELLLEIVQRLDNPALLSLGLTCRCVHSLALDTFFANNKIHDPKSGCLIAYKTPVETLPALRNALSVQRLDQLHYYFNPPVERMLGEVRDLRALISRMPTTGLVKLHFSVVDHHFGFARGEPQVLNSEVWQKEFQGLLDLILEKGCYELYVGGGHQLIGLYAEHMVEFLDVEAARADIQNVIESDLTVRQKRKSLVGGTVHLRPFMESVTRFGAPGTLNAKPETPDGQTVTHSPIVPVRNIKPTKVSIHSNMLFRNPFFEGTIAMLNSGASTISTLSMKLSDLPQETWKGFFKSIRLPQLSDFKITSQLVVPLHGVCAADLQSFLGHHPSIESLHLYGVEVPERVWPPPSLTVPIFSRLKSIIAHPFYVVWVLDSLLLDKGASQNLTNIGISSECSRNPATFNYALFDYTLERVAAFSTGKIKLMLSFAFTSDGGDINDWVEKHLALTNDASKSSIISRLNNVASLVVSSFWHVSYDSKMIEMLPDWLGMFPNLTAIEFVDQPQENVRKLEEKEFVRKVAISCRKVGFLGVRGRKLRLDKVRRDVKIKMNAEGGQGLGKGVSA